MTTHYFDVSDITAYLVDKNTVSGIQRAVLMILRHMARDLGEERMALVYYDRSRRAHVVVPAGPLVALEQPGMPDVAAALGLSSAASPARDAADQALRKYRPGSLKHRYHKARLDLEAWRRNDGYFRRRGFTRQEWRDWRSAPPRPVVANPVAPRIFDGSFRPGDSYTLLGAGWDSLHHMDRFRDWAGQGLRIHMLVHDTIPLLFPGMIEIDPVIFHDWLDAAAQVCTGFLANSRNTARDLERALRDLGRSCPVHVTPLAQEGVPAAPRAVADPTPGDRRVALRAERYRRDDIRELAKLPFALCVGTIEARKNSWRLAQAWAQLAREPGLDLPRLAFAGRRGWLAGDFFDAHAATGGWGGWVHIIDSPSDADLDMLYRRCAFTVNVSLYEGWGLPIGESLDYGRTSVVSRSSAMPEVGGDLVEYCDPASIPDIARAVRAVLDPAHRTALETRIAGAQLRGWADVGRDIAAVLQADGSARTEAAQ